MLLALLQLLVGRFSVLRCDVNSTVVFTLRDVFYMFLLEHKQASGIVSIRNLVITWWKLGSCSFYMVLASENISNMDDLSNISYREILYNPIQPFNAAYLQLHWVLIGLSPSGSGPFEAGHGRRSRGLLFETSELISIAESWSVQVAVKAKLDGWRPVQPASIMMSESVIWLFSARLCRAFKMRSSDMFTVQIFHSLAILLVLLQFKKKKISLLWYEGGKCANVIKENYSLPCNRRSGAIYIKCIDKFQAISVFISVLKAI